MEKNLVAFPASHDRNINSFHRTLIIRGSSFLGSFRGLCDQLLEQSLNGIAFRK